MIIRFRGTNVSLSDELFEFLMNELDTFIRTLRDLGENPIQLDVKIEREGSGERPQQQYSLTVHVVTPKTSFHVRQTGNALEQAVRDTTADLEGDLH